MHVRVLGPLEVERDGERRSFGSPQLRLLLARLAVDVGRVVPADTLAFELLGDSHDARRSLKTYVSRLRKELSGDGELIRTVAPGYLLDLRQEDVDSAEFERLARTGDLDAALQLWRGEPFADVPEREFVLAERARLETLRLAALESKAEQELAAGRHSGVISDLEKMTREHPLRERFWALLMTALYRSGRQAESLRAYQAARRVLVDELGVEPGPELRELERAIIQQEPSLGAPTISDASASDGPSIRLLLVDDHPMWRDTVRAVLSRSGEITVVAEAGSVAEAVTQAQQTSPDVVLMDLELPDGTGADAAAQITSARPETRVLMLTASDDTSDVLAAVQSGAVGYVVKTATASELTHAVQRAATGEAVFTGALATVVLTELRTGSATPRSLLEERERAVLRLLGEGLSVDAVARELGLSEPEVEAALTATVHHLQGGRL